MAGAAAAESIAAKTIFEMRDAICSETHAATSALRSEREPKEILNIQRRGAQLDQDHAQLASSALMQQIWRMEEEEVDLRLSASLFSESAEASATQSQEYRERIERSDDEREGARDALQAASDEASSLQRELLYSRAHLMAEADAFRTCTEQLQSAARQNANFGEAAVSSRVAVEELTCEAVCHIECIDQLRVRANVLETCQQSLQELAECHHHLHEAAAYQLERERGHLGKSARLVPFA